MLIIVSINYYILLMDQEMGHLGRSLKLNWCRIRWEEKSFGLSWMELQKINIVYMLTCVVNLKCENCTLEWKFITKY